MHQSTSLSRPRVVALCGALTFTLPVLGGCLAEMDGGVPQGAPQGGEGGGPTDGDGIGLPEGHDPGLAAPDPAPAQHAPCDHGDCWDAPSVTAHCGAGAFDEDFSTGLYNVHAYPIETPAGVAVELRVEQTGGSWRPAVLLADEEGTILHDGEIASSSDALQVELLASGKDGSEAALRITADESTPLVVYVTSWEVVEGDFAPAMPTSATYELSTAADCPPGAATCPMAPGNITLFGSGYFSEGDSSDPNHPNYNPYKRDDRPSHSGYDLYAPLGTPVLATQSGTIVSATQTNSGLCGLSINLAADSGVTFRYCHLDEVFVTGGHVEAGDVIGTNGKSGNAKNPHIHFVYLDAPNVTGSGTATQKSEKVNAYIDGLCL